MSVPSIGGSYVTLPSYSTSIGGTTSPVVPPSGGTTTPPGNSGNIPGDPTNGLTGSNRDAAKALIDLFNSYGLGSLAPKIVEMIRNGFSADTIAIELTNTSEYKSRFAANETRIKKGLPALSPAEYISTERAYRQLMAAAGLPQGFYDQQSDFRKFLENDMSPTELKDRMDIATEALRRLPTETRDFFRQWYSDGDMLAYALDPTVAQPLVEQRIRAAEAAGIGKGQQITISREQAERIASTGASFDQMQTGIGFAAVESRTTDKLSQIYGGDNVTQEDILSEIFQNDAQAAEKRRRLASQERGAFGGSSGANAATFAKDAGSV